MKRNICLIIIICWISVFTSGCNKYISAKVNDDMYYGIFNRRDMVHADVKMKKGGFDKPEGIGVDQLDNKYEFSTISKEVFLKNISAGKVKLISDKESSLLKY